MENHFPGNTWIKQTSKYISFIRSQRDNIDFIGFNISVKTFKEIIIHHHIIMNFKFRILFLEIFFNTSQLNQDLSDSYHEYPLL